MTQSFVLTNLGSIAVYQKTVPDSIPIIFLHGVYFDHDLWNYHAHSITGRTVVTVDMPFHGKSKNIFKVNWNMEDCARMLLEVLDSIGVDQVYAVGHSWGSMTILRAATQSPERFKAIGLCNMPFNKGDFANRLKFIFQHLVLPLRSFYTNQVAKAMFSESSRRNKPQIVEYLHTSMSLLTDKEVRKTDKAVITHVDDGKPYLDKLRTPALSLKGIQDYVGIPESIEMRVVDGAHTSPLEEPDKVLDFIYEILNK